MRRIIAVVVLATSMAVVGGAVLSTSADAQDKAKAKKKEPMAGAVEIYKSKDGGYRYRVKDKDGKTLAMPARSRETVDDVNKDIEAIKTILDKVKPVEVKE
jgi:uncharacterized protein YegP (UPF0339 family)